MTPENKILKILKEIEKQYGETIPFKKEIANRIANKFKGGIDIG